MKKIIYLSLLILVVHGCSVESIEIDQVESYDAGVKAQNSNSPIELGVPLITCGEATETNWIVNVEAGTYGTPGGFKVEWMTKLDFENNNSKWIESPCTFKFIATDHELLEGESYPVDLADFIGLGEADCYMQWDCNEEYVFRVRAENPQGNDYRASKWSAEFFCKSQPCNICLYGFGYWKTHGPDSPGNQEDVWPMADEDEDEETSDDKLVLGDEEYNKMELLDIMRTPVQGDSILSLKHHLIATKFNILIGGDDSVIGTSVSLADDMIINPAGYSVEEINAVKDALEAYNESSACED